MSLADLQSRFIAALRSDEVSLPEAWQGTQAEGFDVYRNAYRSRLVDAMRETFPRTARLVGDEAFGAAAAHHLIQHPPASWTLDAAGTGFELTVAELFPEDPDVAELAWIEWAMQEAFVARDAQSLDGLAFTAATAGFDDADWGDLRLQFVPGIAVGHVRHDWPTLWQLLDDDGDVASARTLPPSSQPQGCVVWRADLRPVFALVDSASLEALELIIGRGSYGEACDRMVGRLGEERALQLAGEMLIRWVTNGWIEAIA